MSNLNNNINTEKKEDSNSKLDEKLEHRKNIFAGIFLFLFSTGVLVLSIQMPTFAEHRSIYGAPGIVPGILAISLMIMSCVLIYSGWKNGGFEVKFNFKLGKISMRNEKIRLALFVVMLTLYVALLLNLDSYFLLGLDFTYIILTTIFLFCSFMAYGWGRLISGFFIALIFSISIVLIFSEFFRIPLP